MDIRDVVEFLKDTLKYIIVIIIVIFIVMYVVTTQQILGPSMNNTLNSGDLVLLNRAVYKFKNIKRFDIVSFNYSDTKYLVKRVIGLPGEKIEYKNNVLYVNDKQVDEPFLSKEVSTEDFSTMDLGYETIPRDMYLMIGDNRADSLDSRDPKVGLVSKKEIIGKVSIRFWPLNKIKLVK